MRDEITEQKLPVGRSAGDELLIGGPGTPQQILLITVLYSIILPLTAMIGVQDEGPGIPAEQMPVHRIGEEMIPIRTDGEASNGVPVTLEGHGEGRVLLSQSQVPSTGTRDIISTEVPTKIT